MIRRLEEVKKEYNEECQKIVDSAIKNVHKIIPKTISKTIKLNPVKGVIPYIPSLPRTRFYYETPISVSGKIEPVLKYKPLLMNSKQIDVHFFKDTTINDKPYTKNNEILIRLINKTITESNGTINQKLKEVSDFLDIDFDDIKKFYDDMKSKQKRIIKNSDFDFKRFSEHFCSICCLFGCKMHKISSDSCFNQISNSRINQISNSRINQISTPCHCDILGKPTTDIYDKKINLDHLEIIKIYKTFNYDACFTSLSIFFNFNKIVPCNYILSTFGKSKQRIKNVGDSRYKIKRNAKTLFNICSHSGPCSDNTLCECFINNTGCDLRCLCTDCDFMFIGCSCTKGCDLRCRCSRLNKECSIYCNCTNCKNNLVTNSVPKKTFVYPSTVAGYGCFTEEFIKQDEFVIEYVGEFITKDEGQRRSNFYDANKVSYLFDFSFENKTGFIDANFIGNNSRFINHSKSPNIFSKIVEVDKIRRICFFALRDIKIGEELFFDYNYKNEIKDMFGLVD